MAIILELIGVIVIAWVLAGLATIGLYNAVKWAVRRASAR